MNYNFNMGSICFSHGYFFLSRNARKFIVTRCFFAHKFHKYLSLRDGFISHRLHRLHGFSPPIFCYAQDFVLLRYKNLTYNKIRYLTASNALYRFAQILSLCDGFLDGLEELGCCAALDFIILVFRQDMVAFGILICKDNNFF